VRADGGAAPSREGIVVLDRGHRFGGTIATLAGAIRDGDGDAVMALLRDGGDEVVWVDADAARPEPPARVRDGVLSAGRDVAGASMSGDGAAALAALGQFRILCAHRRGPYGVANWNVRAEGWLQGMLPDFSAAERWYVGRPLLVTENDYELGLANGDTGIVVQVDEGHVMAAFRRGGEVALASPSRLGAVDTVYAMTIHKSQGSQFQCAAVLLPEAGSRILTRELLYTAATRAQERLILVGPEETIRAAVARRVARASGLATRLWGVSRGDAGARRRG
jgi:exodeoxyribonuclease V alpha subunit